MPHWCFFFLENNYNHIYKGYNLEHLNNQYLCVCVCVGWGVHQCWAITGEYLGPLRRYLRTEHLMGRNRGECGTKRDRESWEKKEPNQGPP